jgi:peptide/nickel transport system permease protein
VLSWLGSIFRSLAEGLLILAGVALVLFLLFYAIPKAEVGEPQVPLSEQFLSYANDLSFISYIDYREEADDWKVWFEVPFIKGRLVAKWPYLGRSESTGERVSALIFGAIPETLTLVSAALIIAVFFGVMFGTMQSRLQIKWLQLVITVISSSGLAIPSFVFAIFLAWLFGFLWSDFTGLNMTGSLFTYDVYAGKDRLTLSNVILPALALSVRPMAILAQLMTSKIDEIYQLDYIRTARSNGLNENAILWKHAMPNAVSTMFSSIGSWFVSLFIGGVFVEFIFGWKGFGYIVINAIKYQDFRLIMGVTLVVSVTYILVNTILEFLYPLLDPSLKKA